MTYPRLRPRWRCPARVLCALLFTTLSLAAAPLKMSFDLPAAPAEQALKKFSAQSGLEVLFVTATAARVTTNAVKGEFTPREAIDRLLAGTALVANEDAKSGAMKISKAADPNALRAAQARSDRPLANPPVEAQAGRTTSAASSGSTAEETIELSPFEVTTDKDTGFAANSSLAGGRLATELRDTPIAYSVMTREFIDALGITDLFEATEWSTGNTERLILGGGQQDFVAITGEYSTRGFISNAQGNNGGNRQRNFFPMFSYGESYNLERYDFGRGPNSILFGNGTLGGVSSAMTKRAKTDRSFQTIKAGVGSWQTFRGELDVNQTLLDQKAAVRLSLLWQDGEGWRLREFTERKGAFLTTTWKPLKNTEVRLEGEYFRQAINRSRTNLNDRFSGWNGTTTYATPAPLATLPGNANALGISRRGANYYVFDPFGPANAIMHYQNDPVTLAGGATSTTPIAGFTQVGGSFNTNGATLIHAQGVPAGRFDTAIANSFFRPVTDEFTTSPDQPGQIQYFRDVQITVSQRLGDNFFFEFAGDVNTSDLFINGGLGGPVGELMDTFIDINAVLPNGAPNPNFRQPYNDANLNRMRFAHNNHSLRAAAAYVVPENRFGKFAFNVLGGINHRERDQDARFLTLNEGADHRQWGDPAQQAVKVRHYWNAPGRPLPGGFGGSGRDLALAPINLIDPVTGVTKSIQPRWTINNQRADTQSLETSDFDYVLASLNAKFFKDRLILLGAVRYDTYKFAVDIQKNRGDYPRDWDGAHRINRPDAPADYQTLTFQPRNAAGVPTSPTLQPAVTRPRITATGDRNPLFLNDRFQDDFNPPNITGSRVTRSVGSVLHLHSWFNPSINYAETFNPPNGIPNINGQLRPPTVAKGTDYGLRLELLKRPEGRNALDLNFTYYEAEEINAIDGATLASGTINNLINANVIGDQTSTGSNIQGVPQLHQAYRDTQTLRAQGFEIEVAYNPTKALRLTGNYSKPKTGNSDRQRDTLAYISSNSAIFKQILLDAGGLVDAGNLASVDTSIPINQRSSDVQAAVNAYNAIFDWQRTFTGRGAVLGDNQERANLFADYTFQTGWFKRLRVGAGVRWYGKVGIGNRANDSIRNPANPAQAIDDPDVDGSTQISRPSYQIVTGTLAYSWKLKDGRELQANLVVSNLLDDRGPLYINVAQRPRDGDYTSPARQAIPNQFALKKPISYNLSLTVKL